MDPVVSPDSGASLATLPRPDGDGARPDPATLPVPEAEERPATDPVAEQARTAALLVALLAITIPLATGYAVWSTATGADDWNRRISLAPFDLVLVAISGWVLLHRRLLVDLFRSPAVRVGSAALAVVGLAAFAAHPSPLGVALALRLLAGLCVIAAVSAAAARPGPRRAVLATIAVVGTLQAVLAMVQSARGAAFGIEYLDYAGPLYPFGTSLAGRGGLTHPYHLAVVLVVAQGAALLGLRHAGAARRAQLPWLAGLAVISAGIAVTYTRAGALGQVLLVVCLLAGRADRRVLAVAAVAVLLGLGVGGLAFGDGWLARGSATAGQDENASADSNRGERLKEARELIEAEPALGVGPGRYVDALAQTDRIEYLPAHNLVAQEAAELGILGGLVALGLLVLLGLRVLRGGAWSGAVILPILPFLLLDAYPYVFATGLATSALWLGLARASLEPAAATTPEGAA